MDEERPSNPRGDAWARSEARRVFTEWLEKRRSGNPKDVKHD